MTNKVPQLIHEKSGILWEMLNKWKMVIYRVIIDSFVLLLELFFIFFFLCFGFSFFPPTHFYITSSIWIAAL